MYRIVEQRCHASLCENARVNNTSQTLSRVSGKHTHTHSEAASEDILTHSVARVCCKGEMGASSSRDLNEPLIGYKFPTDRVKMRHTTSHSDRKTRALDLSVEGEIYDYLIIFNRPSENGLHVEKTARVSWNEIELIWFQAVPGDEDRKTRGVEWLKSEWLSRFRTDAVSSAQGGDTIPILTFQSLVRELIVDVLGRRAGLRLNLVPSTQGDKLYCLVRAPETLLEKKAESLHYKLRFRGEVDPGVEFWQRWADHDAENRPIYVELREEQAVYEKNKANEILEDLFAVGKIGSNDSSVLSDEPTKKHWSRRIHTLERIADKVPVTNRYPAYGEFSRNPRERHLYEEYHSAARGKTLFLPKDRLYLTKRILDDQFDFGVLAENGVVDACFALHDSCYGEPVLNTKWLLRHWVFPVGLPSNERGTPRVSDVGVVSSSSYSSSASAQQYCPFYLLPWAQPFVEIRAYFGEKVALYFAWVGFYSYSLSAPTLVAFVCEILLLVTGASDHSRGIHYDQIFLGFFIVIWAALYKVHWDVESKYCAAKWGTTNFEEVELDRPQFVGDPEQPRRLSPITNQMETYYPDNKRTCTQIWSFAVVVLCSAALVAAILALFLAQNLAYQADLIVVAECFNAVLALAIPVASRGYTQLAYGLNDQENYRTQTNYDNNLVRKLFFFEIFNNYSALAITAFFKQPYFECISGNDNCLADLKHLLIAIVTIRFLLALFGVLGSPFGEKIILGDDGKKMIRDQEATTNPIQPEEFSDDDLALELGEVGAQSRERRAAFRGLDAGRFEAEIALEPNEGPFDDYAEIVLQMGLVSMFSLGFYVLPLFAMIETLVQIRTDAYKLCAMTRRPDPSPAETVGSWSDLMDTMGTLAVLSNAGIICFTTRSFQAYSFNEKLLIFFVLEQIMLLCKVVAQLCVAKTPLDLYETLKRQQVVVNRHKNVVFDYDDGGLAQADVPGGDSNAPKRGNVDRDNLKMSSVKQATLDENDQLRVKFLQDALNECESDLRVARSEYKRASQSEVLNEELGVSYSRRNPDLALGMVTLTVLEAENIGTRHSKVDAKTCRLVVHIRDPTPRNERKYEGQPGPSPQISKHARLPPKTPDVSSEVLNSGARLVFNQTFSLAPIKTSKAEILIEIMNESKRTKIGTTAIKLTDLSGQTKRSLTLSVARTPQQLPPGTNEQAATASSTSASAVLYVNVQFQYSRLIPIKHRIYSIIDTSRKLNRDMQNIRLGNPTEYTWE